MISLNDRKILIELAKRVDEIARQPVMNERRDMWTRHNRLERVRPMIVVFPEGSWRELLPKSVLRCEGDEARKIEWDLRSRIYYHDHIDDDAVIERFLKVKKYIKGLRGASVDLNIDWGVPLKRHESTAETGAYGFEPVINTFKDIEKLKIPELSYDEYSTMIDYEEKMNIFGDILDVQLKGVDYVSFHIMYYYTHLRGLEQMMYDLYDEPEFAHELVGFFERGYNSIIDQCENMNLFSLNNDGTYQSTGGFGYSTELPKEGFDPERIRPCDMWANAEAQEMAPISPAQTEEFVIQYERRLLSRFGLNGYGCCEGLHDKMDSVFKIPNIRRISISPFADIEKCADLLKGNYIYSWKPHPIYLSGPNFEPEAIMDYIGHAIEVTRDCVIEMIIADTHTCYNNPKRFTDWVRICREAVKRYS